MFFDQSTNQWLVKQLSERKVAQNITILTMQTYNVIVLTGCTYHHILGGIIFQSLVNKRMYLKKRVLQAANKFHVIFNVLNAL